MESDKENINRLKGTTRIPLPVQPLPALPKHLVESNKRMNKDINERYPLKTLNTQALALPGPSRRFVTDRPRIPMFDHKHVTLRQRVEELDWEYKVFKDDRADDDQVILISDDEDVSRADEFKYFIENKDRNCLGEARAAVTPAVKSPSLEPNRVRNIKRSLKRPHSRELQGLSPVCKEQKKVDEKVRRRLQFHEPLQERLSSPDFLKKSYMTSLCRDYANDLFLYLLEAEKKCAPPRISSVMRACVINWLMKVNGPDGNPAIIQTAAWYLDSVLHAGQVQVDKLQLIAAACYWIAHKLHGSGLSASRLVRYSNQAFSPERLLAAEKAILERLKFPAQPVVPQEFITYLAWWCDNGHPGEIEVAATFICMSGTMVDKSLCSECPSVIGAAAVRNALLLLRKRDLMINLQMCPVFRAAEKKATNISYTCSILRRAVRTVASPTYEYRTPFEHYGTPPHYIAQRVINAANELSVMDARNTCRQNVF
ncbi:uncharacterized protein LOC114361557 [Ostrinia furnacalis]|uniref:uncharacterized protein LOC114361557 n=1 Tax=Ostrinia furnacalis TaxID=93504 RepID=UPI001038D4A6|nr:uncharacterized protein LOC114361557 [Ostrinia furnacalis]